MNRQWVTARPSASPLVARWHREDLRRNYRRLRSFGIGRNHARLIITGIIHSARMDVKP